MNLPIDNIILENVNLEDITFDKLVIDLNIKKFTGYVYLLTEESNFFEEVILFFFNGNICGNIYIIEKYDIELYGEQAINYSINACASKNGSLDIYGLTEDQVKLIFVFNENIKFDYDILKNKLKKNFLFLNLNYNKEILHNLLKDYESSETSKKEILKELNLKELL